MVTGQQDWVDNRVQAKRAALTAAARLLDSEGQPGRDEIALLEDIAKFEIACRDVTNAVDDSPERTRPAGWSLDGEKTA